MSLLRSTELSEGDSDTEGPQRIPIPRKPLPRTSTIATSNPTDLSNSKASPDVVSYEITSQNGGHKLRNRRGNWTPIWLRRGTLVGFMILFAALTASLIILWKFDKAQNGIRPTLSSNYYTWTYGPTALLVIVVSLWRQVDYYCKLMQPWQEMYKGPAKAEMSVLLDYISPINTTSFVQAVRNRHIPVAASIAGFATLKLIIIFSTGLLILTPTSLPGVFPTTVTMAFGGTEIPGTSITVAPAQPAYHFLGITPVYTYFGVLEGNIPNPRGIVNEMAFQPFETPEYPELSSFSLHDVDVFVPNVTCEVAETALFHTERNDVSLGLQLDTPTCSVGNEWQPPLSLGVQTRQLCGGNECPSISILHQLNLVNCSAEDPSTPIKDLSADTVGDFRYALVVTNATWNGQAVESVHETSAVICKVDYSINKATVTHDLIGNTYSVSNLSRGNHMPGFTGVMLGEMIDSAFQAAIDLGIDKGEGSTTPFYLMRKKLQGEQTIDRFLDSSVLQQSATQVLGGTAAYIMHYRFSKDVSNATSGDGIYTENRLRVGEVSLWVMTAGFALLILLTLSIVLTTEPRILPLDPQRIQSNAIYLASSPDFRKMLLGSGSFRTSQLTDKLRGWMLQTGHSGTFTIKPMYKVASTEKSQTKKGHWIPLIGRWWMISITCIGPLATIGALEGLYQRSVANSGLMTVSATDNKELYLSRFISTAIMLLVASCFSSLDFTIASFAPFDVLSLPGSTGSRNQSFHILGKIPPMALLESLRVLHFGSAFANSAAIIGSILTVAASGLWTVNRNVLLDIPATAVIVSTWDVSWPNSLLNDSGASTALSDIQHSISSLPSTIWEDLVFPDIGNITTNIESLDPVDQRLLNFTFEIPAVRPVLSCEIVDDEYISYERSRNTRAVSHDARALPPLPPGCHFGGVDGTDDHTNFSMDTLPEFPGEVVWLGSILDLHLGPKLGADVWSEEVRSDYDENLYNFTDPRPDSPAGCPSIGVIFSKNGSDISALLCSQQLQLIKVGVTYDGSDMIHPSINQQISPIPNESTVEYLTNGTDGIDSFPYRIQWNLEMNLTLFDQPYGYSIMDNFFNYVVYGPNGTALEDLAGTANRPTLLAAVQRLYAKYMTLVVDMHFRRPIIPQNTSPAGAGAENRPEQVVVGTASTTVARLQMNYASKLALQIMLAAMVLLGTGAMWLVNLRGCLPRNPCSIASAMALLADSDLCSSSGDKSILVGETGQQLSSSSIEVEKRLQGRVFSLGWWSRRRAEGGTGYDDLLLAREASVQDDGSEIERFGIDMGVAERLGFRETKQRVLKRRLRRWVGKRDVIMNTK